MEWFAVLCISTGRGTLRCVLHTCVAILSDESTRHLSCCHRLEQHRRRISSANYHLFDRTSLEMYKIPNMQREVLALVAPKGLGFLHPSYLMISWLPVSLFKLAYGNGSLYVDRKEYIHFLLQIFLRFKIASCLARNHFFIFALLILFKILGF